jgi:DNA-directed RNA polymerase subunit RPC12/RpoP
VHCMRCAKPMALDRLYYAVDQICSVGYKCLSCGYEETRPQTAVTK